MTAIGIGRIGIWTGGGQWDVGPDERTAAAEELDALGYSTLWAGTMPGSSAGDLALFEAILAATDRLVVATGILDVWSNPAAQVARSHGRLHERHPGRFLLGLGVSHAPLIDGATDQTYAKPLQRLATYLDELDVATPAVPRDERILGVLGPRAVEMAGERSLGAHPYLVTPEHTAATRKVLGAGPILAPEQKVVITTDAEVGRRLGRRALAIYFALPNYTRNLLRLGFDEADFAAGGSDRLVDALVAWGDIDTVRRRVEEHLSAGADHVALQVLAEGPANALPLQAWRDAAPLTTL